MAASWVSGSIARSGCWSDFDGYRRLLQRWLNGGLGGSLADRGWTFDDFWV